MALRSKDGHADKGVSLARFPALVLGSLLLAFGLLALLQNGDTPTVGFPDGTVDGETFFGFEVNGWTAFFTAVAGGLLLFGAAQHLLAKTMSLIVGLALGACSVIALVDGDDVLGLAAANGPTKLGWGIAAAFLLINTLMPRKGGRKHDDAQRDHDHGHDHEPAVAPRRETAAAPTHRETTQTTVEAPTRRETVAPATDRSETEHATRVEETAPRTGRFERDQDPRLDDRTAANSQRDGSAADERIGR